MWYYAIVGGVRAPLLFDILHPPSPSLRHGKEGGECSRTARQKPVPPVRRVQAR